jgi:hypothetical protein
MISLRIILFIIIATSACATETGPPTIGEAREFATVCDKANDGKRLAVEGYLRWPESFTGTRSTVLRLYPTADRSGAPIGVQILIGNQPNQLEMPPKQYSDSDLKVHLASGEVVGVGTKVRVSGNVYFPTVSQDFTCALENPLVELGK